MKVGGITNHIPVFSSTPYNEISNNFLYMPNENYKPKFSTKSHKKEYLAGILAAALAIFSIKKFAARQTVSKNIVEIADETIGLNKIKGCKRTIKQLKEKILYPVILLDEKKILKHNLRTGLLISNENNTKAKRFVDAFMEHAKTLGIHCEELKSPRKKNRLKEVYKALAAAKEYHERTGQCAIVNIGDIGKITNMNVSKFDVASNIEKNIEKTPKGIIWAGWTTETQNIPYFYNNLPTLIVKLME